MIQLSFDDTNPLNTKLYNLLIKFNYPVIWFLDFRDYNLAADQINKFKEKHEIGSHTISHRRLTRIPFNEACMEIRQSRDWIKKLAGKPKWFVSPRGYLNQDLKNIVFANGFEKIRMTTINGANGDGVINRTIHLYPRKEYGIMEWEEAAEKQLADFGDIHIWGHIEEIMRFNYFDRLKFFLEKYENQNNK